VSARIAYTFIKQLMEVQMRTRDPMARDLRQPKYRPRVAPGKLEKLQSKSGRKRKHKGSSYEG
jgi:hypothetical protein